MQCLRKTFVKKGFTKFS